MDLLILTHDDNNHVKGACNLLKKVIWTDKSIGNEDIPTGRLFSSLTEEQILFNFGGNGAETLLEDKTIGSQFKGENLFPNILQLRWEVADNILSSQVIRSPKREELETEMEHLEIVV